MEPEVAPDVTWEHHQIATNGITLHVVQAGPLDGPLVLLLHGFPECWYGWHQQIPALVAAGFRVWAPDQRGYNRSAKPRGIGAYTLGTLAQDILGLIEASGRAKVYLVGHDWGAAVAWWVALTYPERLHKLAILNVPHPVVMRRQLLGNPRQLRKSWYMFAFQLPWLPEHLLRRNNYGEGIRMLKGSGKRTTFTPADLEEYRQAWAQPGALTGMLNWYRAIMQRPPRLTRSPRITVPTLMLWGKQDIALGSEMAHLSLDLCDNGRLIMFDDATHWVQHDEAQAVNQALVEFFKE